MTRWRIWLGRKTSDSTAGQSHTRSRAIRTSVAGAPVVGARRGVIQDSTERRARRGLIRHMESEGVVPKKKKNMTTDVADLDSVPPVTFTNAAGRMYFCHDPTPEELAQAQEKVDREVPLAIAAFQEAQRALALDPANMANVEGLANCVESLKLLFYVAEAVAWEPAMGISINRLL